MQISNMLTISVFKSMFNLYYDDYSREKLDDYRNRFQATHSFFRYRYLDKDIIIIFPLNKDAKEIIKTSQMIAIDTSKEHKLVKRIIHELIFRKIVSTGIQPESYFQIKFISRKEQDNIINEFIPEQYKGKVGYRKGFELDTRVYYSDGIPLYGVVVNSFYRWYIDLTCNDLLEKGINLEGLYVCKKAETGFNLLNPRRTLLGYIEKTDGLKVTVNKDGSRLEYEAEDLYIENSYHNRNEVIKKLFGHDLFSRCIEIIMKNSAKRKSAKAQIESAQSIADWLLKENLTNECGFAFKFKNLFSQGDRFWNPISLRKPVFMFSLHGDKTEFHPDLGLKKFGPFDSIIFAHKKPSIVVICSKYDRGSFTSFLSKLENGLPNVKLGSFIPFGDGFKKKYQLTGIDWHVFEFEDDTYSSYEKAISESLREVESIDLAIIQTSQKHKELRYQESPYYLAKLKFMTNDIPVQEINIETVKKPDNSLAFILNNISLACYAKLGGDAWALPSNRSIDRELVIGLGSAVFKSGRFRTDKRFVGITTVFNSDCRYLLSSNSESVRYEDYFSALTKSLRRIFLHIKNDEGWQHGDTIRLIFHCFKPFKYKEADAIKQIVSELNKEFNIKYAFIKISNEQPLFFVDNENEGEKTYSSNELKGSWMPNKGSGIKFDNRNCLLQMTGAKDLKMASHGMAKPVMVELHPMSDYSDLDYLLQQLYNFAMMSYRSFSSAPLPVTIWYSQLIAKLLGGLNEMPTWDPDMFMNKLKYSRWFL